jgi:hypothetical protein
MALQDSPAAPPAARPSAIILQAQTLDRGGAAPAPPLRFLLFLDYRNHAEVQRRAGR